MTNKPVNVLSFGGCTVNNPLLNLSRRKLAKSVFSEIGFTRTPYALAPGAISQLWDFCSASLSIPADIRKLIYVDAETMPIESDKQHLESADYVLIEISTPYELILDGFILNHNRLMEVVYACLPEDKALRKVANRWKNSLLSQKFESSEKCARDLLPHISGDSEMQALARNLLLNTSCRKVDFQEMSGIFSQLKKTIHAPLGIVLHNFHYMPDGRAVVFPPGLNEELITIANKNNIPVYDPADLVQKHGVGKALAEDLRHWNPDFYPTIADALYEFMVESLLVSEHQTRAA